MTQQAPLLVQQGAQLDSLLKFNEFLNRSRSMERCIWFNGVDGQERNGEHSFHIALTAWYLNEQLGLGLNLELLIKYALIHDLPEVYAGDTSAFPDPTLPREEWEEQKRTKRDREIAARNRIEDEWRDEFP